jgi:hypothetical protein
VETHFIDNYKEDLFVDANNSASAKEAYEAARRSASLVAACLIEKEHSVSARNPPGIVSFLLYNVLSFFFFLGNYICQYVQVAAAYTLYGMLHHLLESIIKLSVQ